MGRVRFDEIIDFFRNEAKKFYDKRVGSNIKYSIEDIVLSGFALFFTQNSSFLEFQRRMQEKQGANNAKSLFKIEEIPTDNHIRDILDNIEPNSLEVIFKKVFNILKLSGHIDSYRSLNNNLLVALDGTYYHSSKKIKCECCLTREKDGVTSYYHSAITPVIVNPNKSQVIALMPEFIANIDGQEKQDCEINASKRCLENSYLSKEVITILGDDLYSTEPFCKDILSKRHNFIFVCKESSHKKLYEYVEFINNAAGLDEIVKEVKINNKIEIHKFKYLNQVPINGKEDALEVNWCEVIIENKKGKQLYKNNFITNHDITNENISSIVTAGRARWKVENENNNTLKTKGYNLEHNFGHGKKHLSTFLFTLNILAFLFHTLLEFMDNKYRLLKEKISKRERLFNDMKTLTTYFYFSNWDELLIFMLESLNVAYDEKSA